MALPTVLAGLIFLVYTIYRYFTRPRLTPLQGPSSSSFLMGNLPELYRSLVGEIDFKWQQQYGNAVRFKSIVGNDALWIADPKALQYIFQTSAYHFPKQKERLVVTRLMNGKGLVWAEGDVHKRQRKVMLPAFGGPESKAFLSFFSGSVQSLTSRWAEKLDGTKDGSLVLDMPSWLSRATMDALGRAAFDYDFGALSNDDNELTKAYNGLMVDVFGFPSLRLIFTQAMARYMPKRLLHYLAFNSSSPRTQKIHSITSLADKVSKQLIEEKAEMILAGNSSRDVLSILVKSNMDASAKTKLEEEEMYAQMRTLLVAGHETTANSLSWVLYELAKHPHVQDKLRAEIRDMEARVHARGDDTFTTADLEAMPYTVAVMKEGLRFDPVVYHIHRVAGRDDVIPLSKPVTTIDGKLVGEIAIPEGTRVVASIAAYNRIPEIWGEDAHLFNPDRWLNKSPVAEKFPTVGVYGNMMTFIGGTRACIGWRFAVIEMQAFLVELINKFEFSLAGETKRVRREPCLVMSPTLEGEAGKGPQLPLMVTWAPRSAI